MKYHKPLFYLSVISLISTTAWIVLMAFSMKDFASLIDSMEDALAFVKNPGVLFYIVYINAIAITLMTILLFAHLFLHFMEKNPALALCGVIFIPIYGAFNLIAYSSQISIVQNIQLIAHQSDYTDQLHLILAQLVQAWDKSAMAFLNNLAYALLAIPSICFGLIFLKEKNLSRISGIFLIINGLAGIIAVIGIIARSSIVSKGSAVGGLFYLIFLVFSSIWFYKKKIK